MCLGTPHAVLRVSADKKQVTGRLKNSFSDGLLLGFVLAACVGCVAQPRTRLGRSDGLGVQMLKRVRRVRGTPCPNGKRPSENTASAKPKRFSDGLFVCTAFGSALPAASRYPCPQTSSQSKTRAPLGRHALRLAKRTNRPSEKQFFRRPLTWFRADSLCRVCGTATHAAWTFRRTRCPNAQTCAAWVAHPAPTVKGRLKK
ncbi:Uncharacterised protein [Kingella potus]|uniref:Uncharacterized protein n=1 Tax=Kingella potus TaxID=265175 RepID=A0A377R5Y2_9NEIS|nr:Uncharacterised protein [Kingella potus]